MRSKSVPLSLLHLAIWSDRALAKDHSVRRPTFTQLYKADRPISPADRASGLARRNGSSATITKAASLEVIQ